MIEVQLVSGGYEKKNVLNGVSFSVSKGEFFGILGPNGSGKTTLMKILSGIHPASKGEVRIKDRPVGSYQTKELAKVMAVLPQLTHTAFDMTVKEAVSIGRYPHQARILPRWTTEDEQLVHLAMEDTGVAEFAHRSIQDLSGGEQQRVFLAQALAQDPDILLLDEPTNHLDLAFQQSLLSRLKGWTKNRNLTIVSIFHDLNMASLYCDRVLLLDKGNVSGIGTPYDALQEPSLKEVYKAGIKRHYHPSHESPQVILDSPAEQGRELEITESMLAIRPEYITLKAPFPLKTISSAVVHAGIGWYTTFLNRHVGVNDPCGDPQLDLIRFIQSKGFDPNETVGMMTAVMLEDASVKMTEGDGFSILTVVTAGTGNAADASCGSAGLSVSPGTINTWVFVNGICSDEAFLQAVITATEAKTRALADCLIQDPVTKTIATGTTTDSVLIAATQQGRKLAYAGTATDLGRAIGKSVYECTSESIKLYLKRKSRA
ncbi:ATP-binding cassette domain-containing protein [Bacillus sp. FJAT-42376]|uniref:adenosylcobinamide amidohydrolase n=1 Tax=Bacillus sp. FJAT-42376 TaxID=2014076 RepID=UPI000F4D6CF4|nr:adenosylcobinamide amidohydrolase [Bacillus sp. FJAT-42376]AZB42675.1 ATP-binding cassette domain-containing protein [Bacillus sp. FJAT-42376]